MARERGHEEDEYDEELSLQPGHVELVADEDHVPHGAGWLYLPAMDEPSGWTSHRVPRLQERTQRRRLGFQRR